VQDTIDYLMLKRSGRKLGESTAEPFTYPRPYLDASDEQLGEEIREEEGVRAVSEELGSPKGLQGMPSKPLDLCLAGFTPAGNGAMLKRGETCAPLSEANTL